MGSLADLPLDDEATRARDQRARALDLAERELDSSAPVIEAEINRSAPDARR